MTSSGGTLKPCTFSNNHLNAVCGRETGTEIEVKRTYSGEHDGWIRFDSWIFVWISQPVDRCEILNYTNSETFYGPVVEIRFI